MANKYLDKTGLQQVWSKVIEKDGETLQAAKNHADSNKTATENKLTADIQAVNQALTDFKSTKGVASGLATLDSEGKIPAANLPSYVDDIIEYASKPKFPTTGESGKIYVAQDNNLTYRWTGSNYVEISASLALGETSSTAYAGNKGKAIADNLNNLLNRIVQDINEDTSQDALAEWSAIGNYLNEWYYYKSDCDELFQPTLVSGTNIKTVNGQSILGPGNIAIQVDNLDMSGYYTKTQTDDLVKNMAEWYVTPSTTSTGIVVASNGKVHASPLSIVDNFDSASNGVPTTDAVTTYLEANYHPLMTPLTSEEIDVICI